jgi:hypothetical protein
MLTSVLLDERNIPQPAFGTLQGATVSQINSSRNLSENCGKGT